MMTVASMKWDLSALFPLMHLFLGPIPASRQDLGSQPKKCTHGGYPLESPLVVKLPHVMSLHQSAPPVESLNHVARSVWAHSNLISVVVQDGELLAVDCAVLRTNCHIVCLILHHLPMGHECFRALFRRCTHEELRAWAKTLPWDHPITRKLDHEVL